MSQNGASATEFTALQQALLTITKLQNKLAAVTRDDAEPIAIIGMGCRLAGGVDGPERFRELLWDARDALSEIPPERGALQGLMRRGGFIDGVDRFDAPFFHVTRREAEGLDPQQRIFLEVSWEALEHAGVSPERLGGTRTAVFAGVHAKDYAHLAPADLEKVGAHYSTGVDASYVAGRLAYFLGLEGTAMAVDTACSSSLVAVHLACQSLRSGESTMAIAGGVKLILSPHLSVFLSKAGALSPEGRCRAFDAAADGMVQGEGCGVVILKRLRDAQRDGDRILATIRGSAVNHNGASGGLTVPSPRAHESLYRFAIERAKVDAKDIDYLEAHGTGTRLGDPIELQGLARVYGAARAPGQPLWIGSSKPNVGHTEAAAGITGLIKAVLVLSSGEIPAPTHFDEPTPQFTWDGSGLEVARERTMLPSGARPHLAAVSSFGMSGVNAHMIVEAHASETAAERPELGGPYVLALSARTDEALRQLAARYAPVFAGEPAEALAYDRCFTAGSGRAHHDERLAIVAKTSEELSSCLRAAAEGRSVPGMVRDSITAAKKGGPTFVFGAELPKQGGLVADWMKRSPAFRKSAHMLDEHFRHITGASMLERIGIEGITPHGSDALFFVQMALTALWKSYGIEPGEVVGQGAGEIAAAVVSGWLSIEDGVRRSISPKQPAPSAEATVRKSDVVVDVPFVDADGGARAPLLRKVAELYAAGYSIRFENVYLGGRAVTLPTYPWQRERYWWDGGDGQDGEVEASVPDAALDGLFFEVQWTKIAAGNAAGSVSGTWLVVADRSKAVEAIAKELTLAGGTVVVAFPGSRFEKLSSKSYRLDFSDKASFVQLLRELSATGEDGVNIAVCSCSDTPGTLKELRSKVHGESVAVMSLVQAVAQVGWLKAPRLYLITRGAQSVTGRETAISMAAAPLWGLGRVLAYEHPELRCVRVDLDPAPGARPERDLLGAIGGDVDEVALRDGQRFAPSLERGPRDANGTSAGRRIRLHGDRTYLVTGGLGGIGLRLVSWLVARGARHIALFGRKEANADARETLERAQAEGAEVATFQVDVSSAESVASALGVIRRRLPPIAGVFHCAGVLDDGSLLRLEPRSFTTVMAPKVEGTWNLHTLVTEPSVELFVLFSSTASMIGAPGQANYAAANSFLDAVAHDRRRRGQPAVSLNLGSWAEVGMAASDGRRGERLAERGMAPMPVAHALAAMEKALLEASDAPAARGLGALDPEAWCRSHPTVASSSLFRRLLAERAPAQDEPRPSLRDELLKLSIAERQHALEDHLKTMVSDVCGIPSKRLSVTAPFVTIGIDSVMSLELRDLVTQQLDVSLPLMSFVDESTIECLAKELLQHFAAASVLGTAPMNGNGTGNESKGIRI